MTDLMNYIVETRRPAVHIKRYCLKASSPEEALKLVEWNWSYFSGQKDTKILPEGASTVVFEYDVKNNELIDTGVGVEVAVDVLDHEK